MDPSATTAEALARLTREFREPVLAFLSSRLSDRATAEDLTHDALVRCAQALGRGADPTHPRAWVFRTARNALADHLRARARFEPLDAPDLLADFTEESAGEDAFRRHLGACLQQTLARLSAPERDAVLQTRKEMATRLGLSGSGAKTRVVRARARLRALIEACCHLITDPYGRVIDWEPRAVCCNGCPGRRD